MNDIPESTYNREFIICPYCGYEDEESREYLCWLEENEPMEVDCPNCGKSFEISYDTDIWWEANIIK